MTTLGTQLGKAANRLIHTKQKTARTQAALAAAEFTSRENRARQQHVIAQTALAEAWAEYENAMAKVETELGQLS